MYSAKRVERTPPLVSGTASVTRRLAPSTNRRRAHICASALVSADLAAFIVAAFAAFAVDVASQVSPYSRALANLSTLGPAWHGWGTLLVLFCLFGYFGNRGHYTTRVPSWTQISDVMVASAVALACDIFLTVAIYDRPVQLEGVLRWALYGPCVLLARTGARQVLHSAGLWNLRTMIVAGPQEVQSARNALLSDPMLGYRLIGTISPATIATMPDSKLIGMLAAERVDFFVVSVGSGVPGIERAALGALRRTDLPIALVPTLAELPVVGFRQQYFLGHDIVMLVSQCNLARPFCQLLKAAFDHVAALLLVTLLAPLLCVLAILVRRDRGPAFYRHRRVGAGGRPFDCIKFRTMVPNANQVLHDLLAADPNAAAEWAATQKLRHDPRVTRIGLFLRRSSLDELPQLFNVLRGEMSLVGPRPIVQAEVARYGQYIEQYYATKPGITGLWQVSGRSDMSYDHRVRLDAWYVRNWTLWHDIAILARTIPAVFLQRGAH